MNDPNTSTERQPMRTVAAAIVLATDLPMPANIRFYVYPDGKGILSMNLDSVAAGQRWSRHLGGAADTYINSDGLRYLNGGVIEWRGWRVQIHATDPGHPDTELDTDTTVALSALAEAPNAMPADIEDDAPRGTDAAEEHAPKPDGVGGYTHKRGQPFGAVES